MQNGSHSLASRRASGFTLLELGVVAGVISLLTAVLIPTVRSVREQSIRTKCASNLRQIGQFEFLYTIENRGWLLLRDGAHPGTMQRMSAPGAGYFAANLAQLVSPQIWFCPNFYDRRTGALLDEEQRRQHMRIHRGGYAMFCAYWDRPTQRVMTIGEPIHGPILQRVNMKAMRIHQLKPDMVRATEWWEPLPTFGGTGGPGAEMTPPHADRRGKMAGGQLSLRRRVSPLDIEPYRIHRWTPLLLGHAGT